MGLDPSSPQAREAVGPVRDEVTWKGVLPQDAEWHGNPFFAGEVEPCINGRACGRRVLRPGRAAASSIGCSPSRWRTAAGTAKQENGSTVGSFHTTINVLEGLLEHERATGGSSAVRAARLRGQEYLLERGMFRRQVDRRGNRSRRSHSSRSRPAITTTSCAGSITCAPPVPSRRRLTEAIDWSNRNAMPMARGRATSSTPTTSISRWMTARASPAAGSHFAPCACCAGQREGERLPPPHSSTSGRAGCAGAGHVSGRVHRPLRRDRALARSRRGRVRRAPVPLRRVRARPWASGGRTTRTRISSGRWTRSWPASWTCRSTSTSRRSWPRRRAAYQSSWGWRSITSPARSAR